MGLSLVNDFAAIGVVPQRQSEPAGTSAEAKSPISSPERAAIVARRDAGTATAADWAAWRCYLETRRCYLETRLV